MPATIAQEIIPRLEELGDQLRLAIDRIPDCAVDEIVEAGPDSAYGSSLVLNRWARLLISTYRDQRFCLVSHPITRVPNWPGLDDFHMQYGNSWQYSRIVIDESNSNIACQVYRKLDIISVQVRQA